MDIDTAKMFLRTILRTTKAQLITSIVLLIILLVGSQMWQIHTLRKQMNKDHIAKLESITPIPPIITDIIKPIDNTVYYISTYNHQYIGTIKRTENGCIVYTKSGFEIYVQGEYIASKYTGDSGQ